MVKCREWTSSSLVVLVFNVFKYVLVRDTCNGSSEVEVSVVLDGEW